MKKQIMAVFFLLAIPWEFHYRIPDPLANSLSGEARLARAAWLFRSDTCPPAQRLADLRVPPGSSILLKGETPSPLFELSTGGYLETLPDPSFDSTGGEITIPTVEVRTTIAQCQEMR